jgi:hypothetical protein
MIERTSIQHQRRGFAILGHRGARRCEARRARPRASPQADGATKAPMHAILSSGCLGNPDPRAWRTSASGASSILAAAARSEIVSRSQTMTDCSGMILRTMG